MNAFLCRNGYKLRCLCVIPGVFEVTIHYNQNKIVPVSICAIIFDANILPNFLTNCVLSYKKNFKASKLLSLIFPLIFWFDD